MTLHRGMLASDDLAVTQEADFASVDWTTTSTSEQDLDLEFDIAIPPAHVALFAWLELLVSHSVAAATFDVSVIIFVDDGLVTAYTLTTKLGMYIPAAGARVPVTLSAGLDVAANLPLVTHGDRRLRTRIKSNTAGTLTVHGFRILHAMVVGDTTV